MGTRVKKVNRLAKLLSASIPWAINPEMDHKQMPIHKEGPLRLSATMTNTMEQIPSAESNNIAPAAHKISRIIWNRKVHNNPNKSVAPCNISYYTRFLR
jgi:hypothetical protein